jgi:LuxR family maltose regulon positive regulatory protein
VSYLEEALSIADEIEILIHPATTDAYLASALVALERGEPTGAALPLHEGRIRADSNRRLQMQWAGMLLEAMLHEAEGRHDEALATIDGAHRELGTPHAEAIAGRELALRCRLLRRSGAARRGLRLLEREGASSSAVRFEHAAAALELGDLPLARKVMDGMEWEPGAAEPLAAVERSILQTWTADLRDDPDWRSHLVEALEVAEHHHLVEVFVRAGGPLLQLVARLDDAESAFRSVVLRRARQIVSPSPDGQLADPLTTRELDILAHLPSRSTNTELAAQFYVSVNTVKSHMAHIYRKLGVASRNEAIARAREIGLL